MNDLDKPISEMTASELEAALKEKKAEERKEAEAVKKSYIEEKDRFLNGVEAIFSEYNAGLTELKNNTIVAAEFLNKRKYEIEGKVVRGAKSFELKNDTIKITVETQERFDFTDEAIVHINAIKDIFRNKFQDRNKGLYNLLDGLLIRNGKGEYDPKLLIKIRAAARELGDEGLIGEVDKLYDCQIVSGTSKYVRVYTRDDKGRWKDIPLNFSSF